MARVGNPSLLYSGFKQVSNSTFVSIDLQEGRMKMQIQVKKSFWVRTGLAAAALAGTLFFMGAPAVRADEGACQRRIAKADHRLHEAAEHHGWESRQVVNARQQLHEAREYCWSHAHKWWDEDGRRWHTDRDWDDHDHDHARDRDHDHDHR
jgi:hypothetical protein